MANEARKQVVAKGAPVDLNKLFQIESSFIADAHNKGTNARGLGQITPVALAEYNLHNKTAYRPEDLFSADLNRDVSDWYVNKRIPQMLAAYNIPDTLPNRLISYNAGIGVLKQNLAGKRALKPETVDYLKKYQMATGVQP